MGKKISSRLSTLSDTILKCYVLLQEDGVNLSWILEVRKGFWNDLFFHSSIKANLDPRRLFDVFLMNDASSSAAFAKIRR